MGSKVTPDRNPKDAVTILEPINASVGGRKARQDEIAEMCAISFHVKLKESPFVQKNVPLILHKAGNVYHILVMGSVIGKLSIKQSEMIEVCSLLGVRYAGVIVKESNGMYARFTRIVR